MQLKLRVYHRLVNSVLNHVIILNVIINDIYMLKPTRQTMKHHTIRSCNTVIIENIAVHCEDGFDFQSTGIDFLNSLWTLHNSYGGRRKLMAITVLLW